MLSQKMTIFICFILLPLVYAVDLDYYYSALRQSKLECSDPYLQLMCQVDCGINPAICVDEDCYCISISSSDVVRGKGNRHHYKSPKNRDLSCNTYIDQYLCQWNCGTKPALCVGVDCYCMTITPDTNQVNPKSRGYAVNNDDNSDATYLYSRVKPEARGYAMSYDEDSDDTHDSVMSPERLSVYASRPTVRHHIAHFCPNLDIARECIRKCLAVGKPAFCGKDHICYCGHQNEHSVDHPADSKKVYAEFKDMYAKYFGRDNKDTVELE